MVQLTEGDQVAVIATGLMVAEALEAAKLLEEKGISATVYNLHTIKPLDQETLEKIFAQYQLVVTVEEHNVIGGMGSAVAEYKTTIANAPRQVMLGFQDAFVTAGSQRYILEQVGITAPQIAKRIVKELE